MQRAIVGTAGHIDHGKTSLVLALTGIDCDRWAEEKARGITIDLGFAHLTTPELQLGFIDVPGHERFLHNALAGLGGIRVMLLVVAADEGVKPQTREHLMVCSLLGIPAALVALTKTDLVSPDLVELATLEVEELLATTTFAGAPIVPVSSTTGAGLDTLRTTLLEISSRFAAAPGEPSPVRLPIDRAFHLRGLGVVVTGTLVHGTLRVGDTVDILPDRGSFRTGKAPTASTTPRGRVRVRSIQVHGETRDSAVRGERTSAQLTGITLDELGRGVELVTPDTFSTSTRLLARFELLPDAPAALSGFSTVRLHHFAREVVGRLRPLSPETLEPGQSGIVEIRLAAPLVAARHDRFIIRRPSPPTTLGGGQILDPAWRRRSGSALLRALESLAGTDESALALWVEESGEKGLEAAQAARRLGVSAAPIDRRLAALASEGRLVTIPEGPGHAKRWIVASAFERVSTRARRVLREYFERERLANGMPKAEAVRRIVRGAAELAPIYFDWLERNKILSLNGDQVNLPGRRAELTGEESRLSTAVLARFERAALAPPGPTELHTELHSKPQIVEGVVQHLITNGRLLRLPGGMVLAAAAVTDLRRQLLETNWERFSVTAFKDRFNLTRKWAIPLLEHLDSIGATRRTGDERILVRPVAAAVGETNGKVS
jgi:selenocysteine-specific elongation factor